MALPVCVSFAWDVLCDRPRGFWGRMEKLGETSISMDVGKNPAPGDATGEHQLGTCSLRAVML